MNIENINAEDAIKNVRKLMKKDKTVSSAVKAAIEVLIFLLTVLINRSQLNSSNSSKPPSEDKNKLRKNRREKSTNNPGGQKGRDGVNLKKVKDPDVIEEIKSN